MNSRPKLRTGARLRIQNFHSILFFEILLATALWSAPEFSNDHASTATNDCSPDITCLENFTSQQYPVDEDGDGYDDAAVSTVRASDLLSDASSDCSDELRFSIYFRYQIEQGEVTPQSDDPDSLVLNCPNYCGWYMVRVYVWDDNFNPDSVQPDGTVGGPNYSYCDIPVLAQDVISVCNCDFLSIYCLVKTKEGTPLKGVSVDLDGEDFDLNGTTNVQGGCYFGYSAFGLVTPRLNTQALNGVSTVDIILIRRHILGIQLLNSPYKRIAADVNNDKTITTTDLVMLRRLILGIDSTFTDNTSWRFVRANYYFPVPTNPWFEDFPETINVNSHEQYNGFTYHAEFIGIKIGDVNASADTDLFQPENDGAQGSRSTLPERLIQPYLQPAPEYGAAISAPTDTCAPMLNCVNGLTLQPDWDGNVFAVIAATDVVTSAGSNCSDSLHFSIYRSDDIVAGTEVPNPQGSSSISLNCNQDCLGTVVLTVYAWDENYNPDAVQPDGTVGGPNYSTCEAYVVVSGLQFCECGGSSITISGSIETDNGEGVANVVVQLSGTSSGETTTNSDGAYAFSNLAPGDYTVSPELDVFPLNGVTTFDVVLISRHILGIQALGSPYKIIAADANNDRKITTVDLIHLRRLILAIDTTFASNTSWRFVPADYVFPVPTNPWFESFPEVFTFNDVINSTGRDFIAIKIGDVNNSADPDPFHSEEPAGRGALPERLIQPYLQPAPEYGAAISAPTDTCAPVIECVNGLAIELIPVDTDGDGIPDSGEYEVSALDMLAQPASSSCSDSLRISIHKIVDILLGNDIPNPDQGSLLLDCEDYAIAYVRIYAWDDNYNPDAVQPDGTVGGPNYSYCETYVIVQANYVDAVCSVESGTWIAGIIETTQSGWVKGVHVQLSGYLNESDKTDALGSYSFARLPTSISGDYTITPTLDTFPQNGLSTFDIILISRHILGIQALDSPYKMIAADVNGDEKITTVDLIHLRRMVLGIDSTFASNTSWRFVSADYVFPVPGDPWFEPFPESKTVLAIFSTTHFLDFIGIKIGDVNNSSDPSSFHSEEPAGRGALPERLVQPYLQPAPEYGANVKAVTDTGAPVIACIGGIAIDLFPVDTLVDIDGDGDLDAGSMQVWGGDFVLNVSTGCGNYVKASIYRTADIESGDVIPDSDDGGSWIFTCNDLGLVPVRIYVWDDDFNPDAVQPDGTVGGPNYSYCEATVLVQDNQFNVCSPDNTSLSGVITTEANIGVGGISVGLSGPISMMTQTNVGGGYAFPPSLPPSPLVPYVITPDGGTSYLNGVSAMDYILIHRHILGIQPLNSPYKLIAADINNDGKITNLDLIHFRRLILQLDNGFIANSSWRFVRADYVFPDPTDPWLEDFPESISTEEGSAFPALNFIAIKIGDVNNSAQ